MHFIHPSWIYDSNIYEVNVRQYTPEGTFAAFKKHLPRLRDMGVEILWFMPITPISAKGRKGSLGSYYAVENYTAINPEFGTLYDFSELVKEAHAMGFKIIIDWVANHSGNDNKWIEQHPDFYCYDDNGIIHPHGWEDVSKLNFDNPEMRSAMVQAMRFWIDSCNIDGFRCDMAHLVPLDFWKNARTVLDKIKPGMFWLAECEEINYHEAFDATYTWKWMHASEVLKNEKPGLDVLFSLLKEYDETFPIDALRVYFTSNHDENSWNGTEYEKYGDAAMALAVFSCTWNGIPMIYSGQELPNHKRLAFFEKDLIEWSQCTLQDFYRTLLLLRKKNKALRATENIPAKIDTINDGRIFSFLRRNENDEVWVIINFSHEKITCDINSPLLSGSYSNVFDDSFIDMSAGLSLDLHPWEYRVYQKKAP
jgi:glycosidase